ncbi:MAG: helix-turn-helix transcriptional regulator, partial [bacterium]|nr:helix-turn-helix transcriptional regulator [bacterium]
MRTDEGLERGVPMDYVERVNRAIDHIVRNLARPLSLEEVSEAACFSPFHFHRVFMSHAPHRSLEARGVRARPRCWAGAASRPSSAQSTPANSRVSGLAEAIFPVGSGTSASSSEVCTSLPTNRLEFL